MADYGLNQTYGTSDMGLSSPSGYAGFQSGGGGDPYGLSGSMGQSGGGFNWGNAANIGSGIGGMLGGLGQIFGSPNQNVQTSGMQMTPQMGGLQNYMLNMLYGGMMASPQQTQNINQIKQGNIQQGTADINAQRDIMNNQVFQNNLDRGMGASAPQQYATGQVNSQALQSISDLINQQSNQAMQQQLSLPYMTGNFANSMMNTQAPRFASSGQQQGTGSMLGGIGSLIGPGIELASMFA